MADLTPTDLVGTWSFAREPGRPMCRLTLSNQRVGNDNFGLSVANGCDQSLTAFGFLSWRIERNDLVFNSKSGEQLRFEQTEENLWRKIPEGSRPLLLSR
jgi:hypothetical protein